MTVYESELATPSAFYSSKDLPIIAAFFIYPQSLIFVFVLPQDTKLAHMNETPLVQSAVMPFLSRLSVRPLQ